MSIYRRNLTGESHRRDTGKRIYLTRKSRNSTNREPDWRRGCMILRPVAVSPVKSFFAMRSLVANALPISAAHKNIAEISVHLLEAFSQTPPGSVLTSARKNHSFSLFLFFLESCCYNIPLTLLNCPIIIFIKSNIAVYKR